MSATVYSVNHGIDEGLHEVSPEAEVSLRRLELSDFGKKGVDGIDKAWENMCRLRKERKSA
jgi:hypothetical protein